MNNNLRGLILHILIIAIVFGLSYFINLIPGVRNLFYGNLIFRIILVLFVLFLYYNFGKAMSKKTRPKYDFFCGNLIIFISIIVVEIAALGLRSKMFEVGPGGSYFRFFMDTFLYPELYMLRLLGISQSHISVLLSSLVPGFLYGLAIKNSRRKIRMRKSIENMRRKSRWKMTI